MARTFLALVLLTIAAWLIAWPPAGMATGPRVGMIMLSLTLVTVMLGTRAVTWYLKRTTRASDEGTCPVGWSCGPCGAFNMKPRTTCRGCQAHQGAPGSQNFEA